MINPPESGRPLSLEARIEEVAARIQRLQVAYRKFFAGALEIPPDQDRDAIERALRALRNVNQKSPVDRFKLANLEAQFNSYREMYGRRLRDLEDARTQSARTSLGAEAAPIDVEAGVVCSGRPTPDAVNALYEGLARRGGKVELETFRSYLDKQMAGIRKKTGASTVQFRLVEEGGKVKLKAKPIGARHRPDKT